MKFIKYLTTLCGVIGLFACSDRPSNFTGRHCLSNTHCHSNEYCVTWSEPIYSQSSNPQKYHEYRDGLCRTRE